MQQQPYTIILIGPQGSGKGTQLERLATKLRTDHTYAETVALQSGSLFRAFASNTSFAGTCIKETINTGMLQPLFLSIGLWARHMIERVDDKCHMLIDGFPRTADEAHVLDSALTFYGRNTCHVIVLEAPEETVRERMQRRARADDTPEAIERRLMWYRTETKSVLEYYAALPRYAVHHVDALRDIDTVKNEIATAVGI